MSDQLYTPAALPYKIIQIPTEQEDGWASDLV